MTEFVIAVDDTDTPDWGGTGQLCRSLASVLGDAEQVRGVSRHQLAVLPGIAYTRKNSANVIHLERAPDDAEGLFGKVVQWVATNCCRDSQPGIAAGSVAALRNIGLGRAAQERVVTRDEAMEAARSAGVLLRSVDEQGRGVIGALAAAALAASGNDGRFVSIGTARDLRGLVTASRVRKARVDEIRTPDGSILTDGEVFVENGLRPALCDGKSVLFVERMGGHWVPLRGRPGDKETEPDPGRPLPR
jgi:hypothetical protein